MIIVARDGSGDFTTIQAAIDSIPEAPGRVPTIILLRMDEYHERVIVNKSNVRIIGEARDRTVITWSACAKDPYPDGTEKGTFLSFTLLVTGNDVEIENLTVRNDAGDGRVVGQAVAAYGAGDRGVWRNCKFYGHQDTLFCGPLDWHIEAEVSPRVLRAPYVGHCGDCPPIGYRQYFEDCYIEGDVDFIFGSYRCWFERCTLFMGSRGGWYTAANTPECQAHGFVFHRCRLTGSCEEGKGYLGRPWRKFARTVFLECEMDEHVAPEGFADWDEVKVVTWRYGEWHTAGARADQSARHPRQKRLTDAEASIMTIQEVLSGPEGWRPDRRTPTWFLCGDSTMADYGPEQYPMMGWGQRLQAILPENIFVENCAVNGRSSKSFIAEKRLNFIELCLRKGDKLIISFSHNDEKMDPERATHPHITYPEYLGMYIDAARRQGAEPILVTPIARRHFDDDGQLRSTHGDFPTAMKELAWQRGVRLVDMERATMNLIQQLGTEKSKEIYCYAPERGWEDNSHLQENGAIRYARLFVKLLRDGEEENLAGDFRAAEKDLSDLIGREDSVLSF